MTSEIYSDVTIATDERFNELLTGLLVTAQEGGVEVEGAWECTNDAEEHDWEVSVIELLTKDEAAEE